MSRPPCPASSDQFLRDELLTWFDGHRRDLPWRRRRDPYAVWISEVMLQQTQVSTVIPYFERFLARFPDARSLAAAELPEVLALWKGLGYYSRARNLHRAAQRIAESGMPSTAAGLRELPGIGRYAAGAIASLAFGEAVAVLDGNVSRVLARLRGIEGPLGADSKRLWAEAEALLDRSRPGAFNESMMELGALVCVPGQPRCEECPIARHCEARSRGRERDIPAPKVRPERKRLEMACAVVLDRQGRLLLARRVEKGLFGGLWELPSAPMEPGEGTRALASLGLRAVEAEPFAKVRRTLTHRELTLHLFRCAAPRAALPGFVEQRRCLRSELQELGISTAMAKALAAIERARDPSAQHRAHAKAGPRARGSRSTR
jgi:A/G-specific adenine glycosylase